MIQKNAKLNLNDYMNLNYTIMKKCFILLVFLLINMGLLLAQDISGSQDQKSSIVYLDKDSSHISKEKFTQKINKGRYTVVITVKDSTTYLAINDAQPADRKRKAGSKRNK